MNRYLKAVVAVAFIAGTANFFMNCSRVGFNTVNSDGSDGAQGSPNGGDSASGTITQPGTPGTTPTPTPTPTTPGTPTPTPTPTTPGTPTPTPTPTTPGTPTPTPMPPAPPPVPTPTPVAQLPKVSQFEPLCQRLSNCLVQLVLDKAYDMDTDFDWKTNDTFYKTHTPPAGSQYVYAIPNYDYVPTSGHVHFPAGQTEVDIHVQDINPDPTRYISIPLIFSACKYGGATANCTDIFRN